MTLIEIMEQQPVQLTAPRKLSRTQQVIAYFQRHPNQWIDGLTFAEFAGAYAWRSRISDARARGMNIENRQRTVKGTTKWFQVSEYRWVPDAEQER